MVELHARGRGVARSRATDDVDVVVDVAAGRLTASSVFGALVQAGFALDRSKERAYRYTRGVEIVDVMVPSGVRARLAQRPVLTVEAGAQAIQRRELWQVSDEQSQFDVWAPSLTGALISKGAAYTVDPRDKLRHLQDAAALFAIDQDVSEMELDALTSKDRRRLRAVIDVLLDQNHRAWLDVERSHRDIGHRQLQRVRLAAGLESA